MLTHRTISARWLEFSISVKYHHIFFIVLQHLNLDSSLLKITIISLIRYQHSPKTRKPSPIDNQASQRSSYTPGNPDQIDPNLFKKDANFPAQRIIPRKGFYSCIDHPFSYTAIACAAIRKKRNYPLRQAGPLSKGDTKATSPEHKKWLLKDCIWNPSLNLQNNSEKAAVFTQIKTDKKNNTLDCKRSKTPTWEMRGGSR